MRTSMRKIFNVAGPCFPDKHYMIPAIDRLKKVEGLIDDECFFMVYAARQSGKTTIMKQLAHKINSENSYYALYCSLETVQPFPEPEKGIPEILNRLKFMISYSDLPLKEHFGENIDASATTTLLQSAISSYCKLIDRPFIIFFDEADCLSDSTLIGFLRQLRDGYVNRDTVPFLQSCALIGMRNIRDYKNDIRKPWQTLGTASPFNVITNALTFSNFTLEQVEELYNQHTQLTGQVFEKNAVELVHYYTNGQPWLVNAIARECVVELLDDDYSKNITIELVEQAKENIILRRDTHIDSLLHRLKDPRVKKTIENIITGLKDNVKITNEDTKFCLELGLVKDNGQEIEPSNRIYKEVFIRYLTSDAQFNLQSQIQNTWIDQAGKVDMNGLLQGFQQFWRENSEIWTKRFEYEEAAPHLILQAFLQRIINGGGQIIREYASNRERMDLCVIYGKYKYPVELKLSYSKNYIEKGKEQLANYMETVGETIGWLIVFNRDEKISWDEKIFWKTEQINGKTIHVVGA